MPNIICLIYKIEILKWKKPYFNQKIDFIIISILLLFSSIQMAKSNRPSKCARIEPEPMDTMDTMPNAPEFNAVVAPMNATPGFNPIKVVSVANPDLSKRFEIESASIAKQNSGNPNIITGNYCASLAEIKAILKDGFGGSFKRSLLGLGAYFSENVLRANDTSPDKGKPDSIRCMLVCNVALGKFKDYKIGHIDPDLVQAPEDCHSIRAFILRDYEYVVYNPNQICPMYLVFYKFTNTALEMEIPTNIPPGITEPLVLMTLRLRQFISNLKKMANKPEYNCLGEINTQISNLLKQTIDARQFLQEVSSLLKVIPPPDVECKLQTEIAKCKIKLPAPAPAPAPVPAPAPALAPAPVIPIATISLPTKEPELTPIDEAASILISFKCVFVNTSASASSMSSKKTVIRKRNTKAPKH